MSSSQNSDVNNSSAGFVYFETSNTYSNEISYSPLESSDFLSFGSDLSSNALQGNNFSPSNYSSPRNHFNERSPRAKGGKNFYSPIKQTGKSKFWRKNMGLTGHIQVSLGLPY